MKELLSYDRDGLIVIISCHGIDECIIQIHRICSGDKEREFTSINIDDDEDEKSE